MVKRKAYIRKVIRRKCPSIYRKQRQELVNCKNFESCRKFPHEKLAIKVIMDCKTRELCKKFERMLDLNYMMS